jgi:hypothetical protein
MNIPKIQNEHVKILFHALGLSCLAGAVFLEALVFIDILFHGYFVAVENNMMILVLELFLTLFTVIYFVHIYKSKVKEVIKCLNVKR